jgi:hypothetical protein
MIKVNFLSLKFTKNFQDTRKGNLLPQYYTGAVTAQNWQPHQGETCNMLVHNASRGTNGQIHIKI